MNKNKTVNGRDADNVIRNFLKVDPKKIKELEKQSFKELHKYSLKRRK